MTSTRSYQHAFSGGEMSPEMAGRVDDARRVQGAKRVRNFIVTPQGAITRRSGSRFVRQTRNNTKVRLLTFKFSEADSIAVEVGPGYFRFLTQGQTILLPAVPRTYVASKNIVAGGFNISSTQIGVSAAHGLQTGDPVRFISSNTPAQIDGKGSTTYFATVISATDIKLSTSLDKLQLGVFHTFTPNGASTARLHFGYQSRDLVRFGSHNYYCRLGNPFDTLPTGGLNTFTVSAAIGSQLTTSAAHGFDDGTAVVFNGARLPTNLVANRVYFVRLSASPDFQVEDVLGRGVSIDVDSTGFLLQATVQRANHWHELTDDNSVVTNGSVYEVPNEYTIDELPDLTWETTFDVLSIAHPNHPVSELRRFDSADWEFRSVRFDVTLPTPSISSAVADVGRGFTISGLNAGAGGEVEFTTQVPDNLNGQTVFWSGGGIARSAIGPTTFDGNGQFFIAVKAAADRVRLQDRNGAIVSLPVGVFTIVGTGVIVLRITSESAETSFRYVVTGVDRLGLETTASDVATVVNNLTTSGAKNTLTWNAVAGAVSYRVYRKNDGLGAFALIGEIATIAGATSYTFVDRNLASDAAFTPPTFDLSLSGTDFPGAVAHFEQRRIFAGSRQFPRRVWGTRTGTEADLTFHVPLRDDDRLVFDLASREAETIRHVVPLAQLVILTTAAEYRVTPVNSDALTPTSIAARAQSFIGSSGVQPAVVNNTLVFAAARGGHVRELGFNAERASYLTGDLSLRATHLFDRQEVLDLALMKAPLPIVWAASTSGKLLAITYAPEESVGAWHAHETVNGTFEACAVVSEGATDTVYVCVQRTINGNTVHYIEQIRTDLPATFADNFYVDCGLTYSGAPATTLSGLAHLEGQSVVALADGVVRRGLVVSGGAVTLPVAASKVHVGLPVTSLVETMPLVTQLPGFGQGNTKNIDEMWVRVIDSAAFQLGPTETRLVTSTGLLASSAQTKQVPVVVLPDWNQDGTLVLQQADPTPLTISSLTTRATAGG